MAALGAMVMTDSVLQPQTDDQDVTKNIKECFLHIWIVVCNLSGVTAIQMLCL